MDDKPQGRTLTAEEQERQVSKRNAFAQRYGRPMTAAELERAMGKGRMGMATAVKPNERRQAIKELMARNGMTKKQVIKQLKVVRRRFKADMADTQTNTNNVDRADAGRTDGPGPDA